MISDGVTVVELIERHESRLFDFDIKSAFLALAGTVMMGVAALVIYLAATDVPRTLYADREADESGASLGMEALYLSEEEVQNALNIGDIVIGYIDETHPVYDYGAEIACMEYRKRALSFCVWTGIGALFVYEAISLKFRRK